MSAFTCLIACFLAFLHEILNDSHDSNILSEQSTGVIINGDIFL